MRKAAVLLLVVGTLAAVTVLSWHPVVGQQKGNTEIEYKGSKIVLKIEKGTPPVMPGEAFVGTTDLKVRFKVSLFEKTQTEEKVAAQINKQEFKVIVAGGLVIDRVDVEPKEFDKDRNEITYTQSGIGRTGATLKKMAANSVTSFTVIVSLDPPAFATSDGVVTLKGQELGFADGSTKDITGVSMLIPVNVHPPLEAVVPIVTENQLGQKLSGECGGWGEWQWLNDDFKKKLENSAKPGLTLNITPNNKGVLQTGNYGSFNWKIGWDLSQLSHQTKGGWIIQFVLGEGRLWKNGVRKDFGFPRTQVGGVERDIVIYYEAWRVKPGTTNQSGDPAYTLEDYFWNDPGGAQLQPNLQGHGEGTTGCIRIRGLAFYVDGVSVDDFNKKLGLILRKPDSRIFTGFWGAGILPAAKYNPQPTEAILKFVMDAPAHSMPFVHELEAHWVGQNTFVTTVPPQE